MDVQVLQGFAGLAVLIAIPIVYAKVAVFASSKWGERGWIGAWLLAVLIASTLMFRRWWWMRGVMAPDPVPQFWQNTALLATGAWISAISLATVLLRGHTRKAHRTGARPKLARVGCLGFALGMMLVVLSMLLQDVFA